MAQSQAFSSVSSTRITDVAQPVKEGGVHCELSDLRTAIATLREGVGHLRERLAVVVQNVPVPGQCERGNGQSRSKLAEDIHQSVEEVRGVNEEIATLLKTLDL